MKSLFHSEGRFTKQNDFSSASDRGFSQLLIRQFPLRPSSQEKDDRVGERLQSADRRVGGSALGIFHKQNTSDLSHRLQTMRKAGESGQPFFNKTDGATHRFSHQSSRRCIFDVVGSQELKFLQ